MAGAFHRLIHFVRYRFLLFAGIFPYLLGSAIGISSAQVFRPEPFLVGLCALIFVLVGVEAFNEYFDWVVGTDRVFQLEPKPVTKRTFLVGLVAFAVAGLMAVYLAWRVGMPVIIMAVLGFLCALFYLAPPIKLAYRGLGEAGIALSYGPLMVLGACYLQSHQLEARALFVSVLPALLLYSIAIMNEVPDYYQDKLVGKCNICVRMGKARTIELFGALSVLFYVILVASLLSKYLPPLGWLSLGGLPFFLVTYRAAKRTYDSAPQFIPTLKYLLLHYTIVMSILTVSFL